MKTLSLQQGTEAWLAHRRTTHNASDAPVMMGVSPSIPRRELVKLCATGMEREHSDYVQKHVLDRGHAVEPALRAMAEKIIGEDLYTVTGVSDDGYLGASFDGVTMDERIIFEAKQHSAGKVACIERNEIPPADYWQVVQQFAVCKSAERCIYLVGDGSESTARLDIPRARLQQDIPKLIAGWKQFNADVASYQPEPADAPASIGRTPDALPALHIEVTGMVTASNLAEFKSHAMTVLGAINRDLQTDNDFADAEQTVKWCKGVEERLEAAKAHALGQTASIDDLFRTIDSVSAETRRIRLELDKLVTKEKESRRGEIVAASVDAVRQHYATINTTLGAHALQVPSTLTSIIGIAIKGKRTITSIRDAADAAVATAKIDASQVAERTRACMAVLAEFAEHESLFADRVQLCAVKQSDDLRNLAKSRVAEYEQREADRIEAERVKIRQEELDRLVSEQAAAQQQDATPVAAVTTESPPVKHFAERAASMSPEATIKLGDINVWIAPLSISADGLASLGFKPTGSRGAAKLYAASDFPHICGALARLVAEAPARAAQQLAA